MKLTRLERKGAGLVAIANQLETAHQEGRLGWQPYLANDLSRLLMRTGIGGVVEDIASMISTGHCRIVNLGHK